MKKISFITALFFWTSSLFAIGSCQSTDPKIEAISAKEGNFSSCTADRDCLATKADCCGCNQGGQQKAISKSEETSWTKQLGTRCKDTMCAQTISQHPSCKKTAHCKDTVCRLE